MSTPHEETRAAATEIQRLAKLRIDGLTMYDASEFCDHGLQARGDVSALLKLKLECVPCIAGIISGEFSRRGH